MYHILKVCVPGDNGTAYIYMFCWMPGGCHLVNSPQGINSINNNHDKSSTKFPLFLGFWWRASWILTLYTG